MWKLRNLPAIALAVLIAACIAGWYLTREPAANGKGAKPASSANQPSLIDQRLLQTAQSIAPLAETRPEQRLARAALRLTDHELDQAFATALRDATAPAAPSRGPLQQLNARIAQLKTRVAAETQHVAELTKQASANAELAGPLELAKAQLALDEDELEDAHLDLARQGGDEHTRLERALREHEAAQHQLDEAPRFRTPQPTGNLSEQVRAWFALGDDARQVSAAERQATDQAAALDRAHDRIEAALAGKSPANGNGNGAEEASEEETAAMVARLQRLSDQRKTVTELDRRIQDCQQLADVYKRWSGVLHSRRTGVLHLLLQSLAVVFAVLFAAVLVNGAIGRKLRNQSDRRRLHQLRVIARLAVQVVTAVVILFLVLGPPTQLATILGLATAGLTVVLKDFIVAFFGWFALMGKNGVRVGDWVEINGVGGEVIEIGVLRTVLLEMGNWTAKGHPTGRRVAFVNSYAIEGQYFNFSTASQWLWDELTVALPAGGDPYERAQQIRDLVDRETAADAAEAERDWQRVTHEYGTRPFSAKPATELRPTSMGVEVVIRYITRAPQRYQVKSRLFESIVAILHKTANVG